VPNGDFIGPQFFIRKTFPTSNAILLNPNNNLISLLFLKKGSSTTYKFQR